MPRLRSIQVDIDVHKAIEGRRSSFDQSENDILREVFGLTAPLKAPPQRPTRSSGDGRFRVTIGGRVIAEGSIKQAYKRAILALAKDRPHFLQRLGEIETPGRRLIAKTPAQLYKNTPSLVSFAEPLDRGWWIDTNLSRQQAVSRLMMACRIAGLDYGTDVIAAF